MISSIFSGGFMNLKKNYKIFLVTFLSLFVIASIAFAIFKETKTPTQAETPKPVLSQNHHYIAYYFHGNARCQSCYKIETYTLETMKSKFAKELAEGTIVWEVVNVEQGMNQHFISEYALSTKSVVLSEVEKGKEVRWKNLDKIWELLGNQTEFQGYIESEVKDFLNAKTI